MLSDSESPTILVGPTAEAALDPCGPVRQLPQESADDLTRVKGVTRRRATVIAEQPSSNSAAGPLTHPASEWDRPGLGSRLAGGTPG